MNVQGVGGTGKDVKVNNDFMIHIPYGCCYDLNNSTKSGDTVLTIVRPESLPSRYKEGRFSIPDETEFSISISLSLNGTVTLGKGETEIDYPIEDKLKKLSKDAENTTISLGLSIGESTKTITPGGDKNNFHRMYKVVKNAPFIKAGYYTMGIIGQTVYNVVLITPSSVYLAMGSRFSGENYKRNEKFLDSILSSVEALNTPTVADKKEQKKTDEERKGKNTVGSVKKPETEKIVKTIQKKKEESGETYADFSVNDNLASLKKYISAFSRTWEKDLKVTNDEILNERATPITRVNDSRIKKIFDNTDMVIDKHIDKLQEVIDKLDEMADDLRKTECSDSELIKIIHLIEDGVEKLHIRTEVEVFKDKKEFKRAVGSRYSSILRKWRKVYNALPSIKILALKKEIEDKEKETEPLKKQIASEKRKRTTLSGKITEVENNVLKKKDEFHKARAEAEDYSAEIDLKHNRDHSEIRTLLAECATVEEEEKTLREKSNDIKEEMHRNIQPLENSLEEEKHNLERFVSEKDTLESEERIKKSRAEKAFLFKKKKQAEYEDIRRLVEEKQEEIKQCEVRIDCVDSEINTIKEEAEKKISEIMSEIDKLKWKGQAKKGRIEVLEAEIERENKKKETLRDNAVKLENELKELERSLKEKQKDLEAIEKQIAQDEKTRDAEINTINQIKDNIIELEKEIAQREKEDNIIKKEKNKTSVEKESVQKKEESNERNSNSRDNLIGVRFFIHDEINQAFFNYEVEDGSIGIPFVSGDSFSADIIEQPFHYKVNTDDECVRIEIYIRREIGVFEGDPNITYTVFKDGREPEVGGSGGIGGEPDQIGGMFLKAACVLRGVFDEKGLIQESAGMDPNTEGYLVTHNKGDLIFERVSGKKRPEMACTTLLGGVEMKRPYMDEISAAWSLEMMSSEDLTEMAENGDTNSMKKLAMLYLEGDDETEKDPKKSAAWMEKAAVAGDSEAQFNIGLFYAKGFGVKRDFAKMSEWMKKALNNGEEDAGGFLKEFVNMEKDLKKAEKGDAEAQAAVAAGYMKLGPIMDQAGVEKDYAESVKWATKAAGQNNGFGLWTLALAYEHGRGVKKSAKKAIELYQKGVDIDDPRCLHNLGCQYLSGENIKKDAHKGFALIKRAAEQGYGLAMRDLGRCYQFATGTPGNMKTAIKWYEKALKVIDDPELERKTALFKTLADSDPHFSEDYPEDESYEPVSSAERKKSKPKAPLTAEEKKNRKQFFQNRIFVLSGFDSITEPPIREVIESNGGIIKSSTVLDTDYLIYHDKFGVDTKKHERALELNRDKGKNIKLIPLSKFQRMLEKSKFNV